MKLFARNPRRHVNLQNAPSEVIWRPKSDGCAGVHPSSDTGHQLRTAVEPNLRSPAPEIAPIGSAVTRLEWWRDTWNLGDNPAGQYVGPQNATGERFGHTSAGNLTLPTHDTAGGDRQQHPLRGRVIIRRRHSRLPLIRFGGRSFRENPVICVPKPGGANARTPGGFSLDAST